MAASFYNSLTGTKDADAAGTEVELPGETLGERRKRRGGTNAIEAMSEEGIDVSNNLKTQLTPEMLDRYDYVISMADPEYTPTWLSNHPKYEYWSIADPGGKGLEETRAARDNIKANVRQLIERHEGRGL